MAETISMDEFRKVDLRIGRVLTADPIPGRARILKLKVDLGTEQRQMVVGGAEFYPPSYFIGRRVVVVANLAPKLIAGVESRGMVLAAVQGERPIWLTVDEDAPPGTKII
ncbi:MAG: tRNA-binding protein [Candidatus Bathyarchaeia archaeon]